MVASYASCVGGLPSVIIIESEWFIALRTDLNNRPFSYLIYNVLCFCFFSVAILPYLCRKCKHCSINTTITMAVLIAIELLHNTRHFFCLIIDRSHLVESSTKTSPRDIGKVLSPEVSATNLMFRKDGNGCHNCIRHFVISSLFIIIV